MQERVKRAAIVGSRAGLIGAAIGLVAVWGQLLFHGPTVQDLVVFAAIAFAIVFLPAFALAYLFPSGPGGLAASRARLLVWPPLVLVAVATCFYVQH